MRGGSDCSTGPELREVSRSEEAGEEVEQEEGKKTRKGASGEERGRWWDREGAKALADGGESLRRVA